MTALPALSVLVVEDDPDIQESLLDVLSLEGYEVARASNGAEALEKLSAGLSVQLILLDLMMPVMDGLQFREKVLQDAKLSLIPILIMSADGHLEQKLSRVGVTQFLKKPIDVDILLGLVSSLISSPAES